MSELPKGPSLKARAISLLSRREHSSVELRRKLARYSEDPSELDAVLEALRLGGWLSEQRFAESLVHRKASRQGTRRILNELRQHHLPETTISEVAKQLEGSEFERARAVWLKKYGVAPADAKEYARQFRYMAARGFRADGLRRILAEVSSTSDDASSTRFDPDDLPPIEDA